MRRYVLLFDDGSFSGFATRNDVEHYVADDNCFRARRAKIPANNVPISEADYQDFIENQTSRRWDVDAQRFVPIEEEET
ncbi:hypothetical protein [Aliihoeflea sp. PC F10.4]